MNKLKRGIGKILGLLAALVFAVAALFGCGPNAKPTESPEPTTPPVTTETPVPGEEVTITVRYVYPDGSESTTTQTVKVGDTYSIASPKLEGYYADQSVVTGVASENATIVVTYRELTDEMVVKRESGSLGTMRIGANDLITAESGVAFGFFISGAAKASDWNPLINVDGYILTHGNLDSWTVDEHNCYPLLTQFGGAWDCIIQDEEAFLIVNVQRDAISYYRNGELVLRYAREDTMNGTPAQTVAAFIDGFLAGIEVNGFTLDASYSSLRDLYLCRGLAEEEVTKLYESATSDQTSYQLTIRYVYEDGSEAAPSEIRTVAENAGVAVASPVIDGFTPDQRTVSVESMTEDMTITVVYTQAVGRTYVQTYTQEGPVAAGTTIPASPEVTASAGVSIAFYLGGSSSESSWNPLVNAGGYIVTYGNLDSWSQDEHNLYPSLTAHGGAWDALVTGEEVYIIINASEDGIDIYKNGELALRYAPSDRMNGAPAQFASAFIERFLANVEADGFVFAETAYEIRDLKVGTALPDQQVREFYEEQLMSGSTVLSIRYVDEEGNLLAPVLHKAVEPGKGYQISSPRIPGYTTDTNEVVGRMGEESVEIEVVYRAIGMKTLTILSVFEDGSEALASQTYEYSTGSWYSVQMPLMAGYSASDEVLSGNLSEDTTRIVVYQKDPYQKATVAYDRIVNPAPLRNTNASKENGLFVSFFLAGSQSENSWGSLLNAGGWKITYGNLDAFPMANFNAWPGLTEHGGAWDALITANPIHVIVNVTMDGIAIYKNGALAIYYGADEWMNALEGEKTKMTVSTFITEFLNYAEQDILCIGDKCYDITNIRAGVALNETEIEMEYRRAIGENPHVVTVAHVDENGQAIASSETVFVEEGSTYTAAAKQILGYEATEVPTATVYSDRVLLVKYTSVNVYNVNVTYVYEDGSEAAPPVRYQVNEGTAYSLPSPYIVGYTTDDQLYEGSGLTADLNAQVVYREDRWQRMFEGLNGRLTQTTHLQANPAVTQDTGISFSFFLSDAAAVGDWSSLINAGGLKITYANLDSWPANEHNMWPAATAFGGEWNVMLTAIEGDYFTINLDARGVAFYKNGTKVLFYAANETMNGTGVYQVSQFVTDFISAYLTNGAEFGEVLATIRELKVGVGQTDYEVLATYAKAIGQDIHSLLVTFVDENGTAVADPYFELAYGENNPYDVTIPSVPGMRPDRATLTGTNVGDEAIVVTYTAIEYSLTIRYVDELGNPIAENYQTTLAYGDSYDVASPTISEKTPDRLSVSGVIDENSEETIEIVVTYYGTTYEFIAMLDGVQAVSEELTLNSAL
ncbi:MAG: MucBP domain-containing protein, partial [Christensenellaceae bacterium]